MKSLSLLVGLTLLLPAAASADNSISIGVLADEVKNEQRINLVAKGLETVTLKDLQYGQKHKYRGKRISHLVALYRYPFSGDLAVLCFDNGMKVPIPLVGKKPALDPFVAVQIWSDDAWVSEFPKKRRGNQVYQDRRPLEFKGNKIVVDDKKHPMVPAEIDFTPWEHVTALTDIQLTTQKRYFAQFDSGKEKKGLALFKQSCQFCHGVAANGATHGWDFLIPLEMAKYRKNSVSLFYHVRFRVKDAPARGFMMPALKHISQEDAEAIWRWMKTLKVFKKDQ